tara:strand:+ start:239 stop:709 length:471 start_codon:yes stop_codon:yes gene_type:complete
MGSRRIGLARIETLIENLNRAINLGTTALTAASAILTTGDLRLDAGSIDIADGVTVVQASNKTTGVTASAFAGKITMNGAALADGVEAVFTVTNTKIAATDIVIVNHASVGTAGAYMVHVVEVGAGSFKIGVGNVTVGSLSEAIILHFAVIKMKHA